MLLRDILKLKCFFEKTYTALEEWIIRTYCLMSDVRISQVFCLWLVQLHLRLGRANGSVSQDGYVFTSRVKEVKPFFRPPAAKITFESCVPIVIQILATCLFLSSILDFSRYRNTYQIQKTLHRIRDSVCLQTFHLPILIPKNLSQPI